MVSVQQPIDAFASWMGGGAGTVSPSCGLDSSALLNGLDTLQGVLKDRPIRDPLPDETHRDLYDGIHEISSPKKGLQ